MHLQVKTPWLLREPVEQFPQFVQVAFNLRRRSATNSCLALRHRLYSLRPRDRQRQSRPFEERARKPIPNRLRLSLSQSHPESIAQVANHLARGHLAPSSLAPRSYSTQPPQKLELVVRISQCFHEFSRPSYAADPHLVQQKCGDPLYQACKQASSSRIAVYGTLFCIVGASV